MRLFQKQRLVLRNIEKWLSFSLAWIATFTSWCMSSIYHFIRNGLQINVHSAWVHLKGSHKTDSIFIHVIFFFNSFKTSTISFSALSLTVSKLTIPCFSSLLENIENTQGQTRHNLERSVSGSSSHFYQVHSSCRDRVWMRTVVPGEEGFTFTLCPFMADDCPARGNVQAPLCLHAGQLQLNSILQWEGNEDFKN